MSKESKTLDEVMKTDEVEKEKAEQELRALQEKLKAATENVAFKDTSDWVSQRRTNQSTR